MPKEETAKGAERRTKERIHSLNFVTLQYLDQDNEQEGEEMGRTMDISSGGIKLEVPHEIPSKHILLTIALEESVVQIQGEITHTEKNTDHKWELGIRFVQMDPKSQATIENFLQHLHTDKLPKSKSSG